MILHPKASRSAPWLSVCLCHVERQSFPLLLQAKLLCFLLPTILLFLDFWMAVLLLTNFPWKNKDLGLPKYSQPLLNKEIFHGVTQIGASVTGRSCTRKRFKHIK